MSNVTDFTWTMTEFDIDFIYLQINFTNPDDIAFDSRDYITVTFWGIEYFKSF